MDAAFEEMLALGERWDGQAATLHYPGPRHRDVFEATIAFWNGWRAVIEAFDKTTTELRHLGEGMRLAALIDDLQEGSPPDF